MPELRISTRKFGLFIVFLNIPEAGREPYPGSADRRGKVCINVNVRELSSMHCNIEISSLSS